MNNQEGSTWDDVAKRRKSEQSRHNTRVLATCGVASCWGFTLVTIALSLVISPEFYQEIPIEWNLFYNPLIMMLIISSIAVTLLYIALRVYHGKRPLH